MPTEISTLRFRRFFEDTGWKKAFCIYAADLAPASQARDAAEFQPPPPFTPEIKMCADVS